MCQKKEHRRRKELSCGPRAWQCVKGEGGPRPGVPVLSPIWGSGRRLPRGLPHQQGPGQPQWEWAGVGAGGAQSRCPLWPPRPLFSVRNSLERKPMYLSLRCFGVLTSAMGRVGVLSRVTAGGTDRSKAGRCPWSTACVKEG